MTIITIISYLISMCFLFLLYRVIRNKYRKDKYAKNLKKRSDEIKEHRKELLANGEKEFTFGKKGQLTVKLFAPNYKAANVQFQTNLKNGMYNL